MADFKDPHYSDPEKSAYDDNGIHPTSSGVQHGTAQLACCAGKSQHHDYCICESLNQTSVLIERFVAALSETRRDFQNVIAMTSSLIRVHGSCCGAHRWVNLGFGIAASCNKRLQSWSLA